MAATKLEAANLPKGFTIVETMFVLAIAGLILLIVFMAIPALQRNSRNNIRKQDVTNILQAVSHYELSNSGNFPDSCGLGPKALPPLTFSTDCFNQIGNSNDYFLQYEKGKLYYYDGTNIILDNQTSLTVSGTAANDNIPALSNINLVEIYNFETCDTTTHGATLSGAGYNSVVALYAIETNGGVSPQCDQL
jgi:prepilin-type N-terminal cleavage/methylation domain-containing protein